MRWLFLEFLLLAFGSWAAFAQQIAPGIELPRHGDVWVLDGTDNDAHLEQLKYLVVRVNHHHGANYARWMAWPVGGKYQSTVEIQGMAASIRLSEKTPEFYIRSIMADPEEAAQVTAPGAKLAILRLYPYKDSRVLEVLAFSQFTGAAHHEDRQVKLTVKSIPDTDWLRATPAEPLAAGEYALAWLSTSSNNGSFPEIVYDFGIGPVAAKQPTSH
jgi:hypothetical protein